MELRDVEYFAKMFFRFCRVHPELCPHDYIWNSSYTKDGKEIETYTCRLCGGITKTEKDT